MVTQLRRQRLSMIRDIANPRKCSDGFSHFKCTNIRGVMSCSYGSQAEWGSDGTTQDPSSRIDDRFIYGQDVELWNEAVGSNLVLIVNDEIAADSRQWAPMRVAAPEGVWTRFFSVQRAIDIIHTATPRQLILIMVASPADALALVKGGVPRSEEHTSELQSRE